MAVIVLPGADFSANNIGHIDLFIDFHATTKQLFSRFSITEDTSNPMQVAVDSFVRSIVNAGMWGNGKITAMCLPFLTNMSSNPSVSDACMNVISTDSFFSSGHTSRIELYHNGLRGIIGQNRAGIPFESASRGSHTSCHFAVYILEQEPTHTNASAAAADAFALFVYNYFIGLDITANNFWMSASNRVFGDTNYKRASCMRLFSYDTTLNDAKGVFYCNGQQTISGTSAVQTSSGSIGEIGFGSYVTPYAEEGTGDRISDATMRSPAGIVSVGGYLTAQEAATYTTAADALVQAIHAYLD